MILIFIVIFLVISRKFLHEKESCKLEIKSEKDPIYIEKLKTIKLVYQIGYVAGMAAYGSLIAAVFMGNAAFGYLTFSFATGFAVIFLFDAVWDTLENS